MKPRYHITALAQDTDGGDVERCETWRESLAEARLVAATYFIHPLTIGVEIDDLHHDGEPACKVFRKYKEVA